MLLEKALSALYVVSDPERLGFIGLGTFLGLLIGVVPGMGGLVALALLLPFTFAMDPYTAVAFLIGVAAVTVTSDTIPAVLFGVPGTVGSAATVMDGHPMARRGEAGRAFGAAFSASVIGGLFGAALIAFSIPILRPVMLSVGTPELLAICTLGLTLVAALSQGSLLRGLAAACLGVLFSTIGDEAQTGELRWTFDQFYLWDGIPLVSLALGLFAIPELFDLAISQKTITAEAQAVGGARQQLKGVRDTLRNWPIVLRSSAIGSTLGAIPGIGAAVIDWIAYGLAAKTVPGASETFGKGDVRGVIASESSNNAKEGGALVPTLAFGVPGAASMALLLGAFIMHGITPGPKMLSDNLDVTYTLIWSVALANIIGAGICFLLANQLAKIATIQAAILVPLVLAVTIIGAYQGARDFLDLIVLFSFGFLGWFMKRFGWARPPLVLGFVLGGLVENYLFISTLRYGAEWLKRPGVIAIFAVLLVLLLKPLLDTVRRRLRAREMPIQEQVEKTTPIQWGDVLLWFLAGMLFLYALASSWEWEFAARLMPQVIAAVGLLVLGSRILNSFVAKPRRSTPAVRETDPLSDLDANTIASRFSVQVGWAMGIIGAVLLIGMLPALLCFMLLSIRFEGRLPTWKVLAIVAPAWIAMVLLFDQLLSIPWPDSYLGEWLGDSVPVWFERLV